MRQGKSLQKKMNLHMVLFAVIPLCLLLIFFLVTSWQAFLRSRAADVEYQLKSADMDMQLIRTQTENVVHTFTTSEDLASLISSKTKAEWITTYNSLVYQEATRVEGYLSALDARIILIYNDGRDELLEHWSTLLNHARFADHQPYQAFVASGARSGWSGVVPALPDSVSSSFDFRAIGDRMVYFSLPNVRSAPIGCVIECALSAQPFVDAAERRLGEEPYYLYSAGRLIATNAADRQPPALADIPISSFSVLQGAMWQRADINGLNTVIAVGTPLAHLMREYLSLNGALLLLLVVAVVLLFFISRRALKALLRRMENLAAAADRLRVTEAAIALPADGDDEVGRVVLAINRLLERIELQQAEVVRQEKDKRKMHSLALQYQLNPHFLFNSLLWVQMEMERQGMPPETCDSVALLGRVLRYNLSESMTATVQQEQDHLRAYTSFMSTMKQQTITMDIAADEGLADQPVPRFLLQPIVENALQHGLMPGKALHIDIRIRQAGDHLSFTVSNNGKPISPEHLARIQEIFQSPQHTEKTGYGLSNLIQRLRIRYGDQYSISVSSSADRTAFQLDIPMERQQSAGGETP